MKQPENAHNTSKNGAVTRAHVIAIILAAGSGERMGAAPVPKQFAAVGGRSVLSYSLRAFQEAAEVDRIVVVCAAGNAGRVKRICARNGIGKFEGTVDGGCTRRESSEAGVRFAAQLAAELGGGSNDPIVLIHDAARPNINPKLIAANIALARKTGACVTATPSVDTVMLSTGGETVDAIPARGTVWCVQTPQGFRLSVILEAHANYTARANAGETVPEITDDGGLVRFMGGPVAICPSGPENLKLTVPEDFDRFAGLLKRQAAGTASQTAAAKVSPTSAASAAAALASDATTAATSQTAASAGNTKRGAK